MSVRIILRKSHKIISFLLLKQQISINANKTCQVPTTFLKNVHPLHVIPVDFYDMETTVPDRSAAYHAPCEI